jgi:hypothetical protein
MAVPNIFGTATSAIPLSQLDTNFATPVTIGNTAVQLGNTVTSFGNVTLTNVTISSGNVTVSAGSNTSPSITTVGDTNTGIFFPAADTIAFTEGGVESMRLNASGQLTVGNTSTAFDSTSYAVVGSGTGDSGLAIYTSAATAGYLQFADGVSGAEEYRGFIKYDHSTNAMSFSTNSAARTDAEMTIDSSGNVGIGTSSPSALLDVAASGGATIEITNSATSSTTNDLVGALDFISADNSSSQGGLPRGYVRTYIAESLGTGGYMTFGTAATGSGGIAERARIDSSGNLGLGVTPSAWKSTYKALAVVNADLASASSVGLVSLSSNAFLNASDQWIYKITDKASRYQQYDSVHSWYTAASGTAGNAITFTQAMTLTAAGSLGLGTTSPTFDDGTGMQISRTGVATYRATNTTGNISLEMKATGSLVSIASRGSYPLIFEINGAEVSRFDSSGNLLVNCTSGPSSSVAGVLLRKPDSGPCDFSCGAQTTTTTHLRFTNGNGIVGSITTNGSATAYNTSSDYRLKNSITPMVGALAKVALLKPCTYKWNADGSDGEGFIAHELAEVVPNAVVGNKDAVDAEGNIKPQGVDTSFLVATLTAAIQEQQALITQLTARLDAANL